MIIYSILFYKSILYTTKIFNKHLHLLTFNLISYYLSLFKKRLFTITSGNKNIYIYIYLVALQQCLHTHSTLRIATLAVIALIYFFFTC